MDYKAIGLLHEIFDEQQVSEKFRKREFVLEVPGQYPEHIKFQAVQDKCDMIDAYKIGDEVEVSFNLRGRGYNKDGRMNYFTNLDCWKIQPAGQQQAAAPRPNVPPARQQQSAARIASDDDNDLPF